MSLKLHAILALTQAVENLSEAILNLPDEAGILLLRNARTAMSAIKARNSLSSSVTCPPNS